MRLPLWIVVFGLFAQAAAAIEPWKQSLDIAGQSIPIHVFPARGETVRGAVLIAVAAGPGGVWPHSLSTLAERLPDDGWHSLSIAVDYQLSEGQSVQQRLNAALNKLPAVAGKPIVIVAAREISRTVGQAMVAGKLNKQVSSLILLDRPQFASIEDRRAFHKLQIGVLDIVSNAALPASVLRERKYLAAEHKQLHYRQLRLPQSGPNWSGAPDRLGRRIIGWLNKSYKG